MDSTKSPRQLLQALCTAWRRYVALPHGRANMDEIRDINVVLARLPPGSLMASEASRGSTRDPPRYYLLLGQLLLDADALELAFAVLKATAQRVTSDGCNATAAQSTYLLVVPATSALELICSASATLGILSDAMESKQGKSAVPPEERLLGGGRGMTAGGVRDQMLEQLSDIRLHRAITDALVAFRKQTDALESALAAGHEGGRAIRSRARSSMADALGAVQGPRQMWLSSAARLLHACMEAVTHSETADSSSSSGRRRGGSQAPAGGSPQAQRLLDALEGSCLLEAVCGEMLLLLPGSCTPSADQIQMLCQAVEDLVETQRELAKLARHRLQRLQAGGPSGPGGTPSTSAGSKGGEQPAARTGASSQVPIGGVAQAVRLLLPPHVQQLQLCLLRRWVVQQTTAQREQQQGVQGAAGAGGPSPAAEERTAASCGWPFLDSVDVGYWSEGLLDAVTLMDAALRTWDAVWEVWEAVGEEQMAEHGLAAELGEAEHGGGGGGTGAGRCLMPALLLTPQVLQAELLHFLQAAECAVVADDGGGGGGGGHVRGGGMGRAKVLMLDLSMAVDILARVQTWQAERFPPPPPEPEQRRQQQHLAAALGGLEAAATAVSVFTVLASKMGKELAPPQVEGQEAWKAILAHIGLGSDGTDPGEGSDEAGGLTGAEEEDKEEQRWQLQGLRLAVEDSAIKAMLVVTRMSRYCSGFEDPMVERPVQGDSTASEPPASATTASASPSSSASANPTAADPACTDHSSSAPASAASLAAAVRTLCLTFTKQAVSRAVCSALLRAGWLDSLARLARMAGAALVRGNGFMHGRLQQAASFGVGSASAMSVLKVAASCNEHGGVGPGADPSAAAHGLAWLLESTGKAALCACSCLEESLGEAKQRAAEREELRRGGASGSSNRGGGGARGLRPQRQKQQQQQLDDALDEQCREQLRSAQEAAGSWASLLNEQLVELLTELYGPTGWFDAGDGLMDYSSAPGYVQFVAADNAQNAAFLRPHLSSTAHAALRGAAAYCAIVSCRLATCQLEAGEVLTSACPEGSPAWAQPLSYACELLIYPLCDWVPPRQLLVRANPLRLFEAALRRLVGGMEAAGGGMEAAGGGMEAAGGGGGGGPGEGDGGAAALRDAAHAGTRVLGAMARMAASEQLGPHVAAWLVAQPLGVRQEPTAGFSSEGRAGAGVGEGNRGACGSGMALGSWADVVVLVADGIDWVYGRQWWAGWTGRLAEAAREAAACGVERGAGEAQGAGGGAEGLCEVALALCVEWHGEVWPGGELPAGLMGRGGRQRGQAAMAAASAPAVGGEEGAGRESVVEAEAGGADLGVAERVAGEAVGMEAVQEVMEVLWPRVCANEGCQSFSGERDGALGLRRCGRCDARYCCRECQTADWRAGHKRECGAGGG